MNGNIEAGFAEMEKKLKFYIDNGRVTDAVEMREEPVISIKPDVSMIRPLKKMSSFSGSFVAIDCSTRTLKRANNWGIYLMRAAYAFVKERDVYWDYQERICTVVGDAHTRSNFLTDIRIEMESQIALALLQNKTGLLYYEHVNPRSNYLLLDGGGYFGGERKFRVALYEKCERDGINLLAISKNSPSLHDEKGRDLIATTSILSPYSTWLFHPVRKADKDKSLYGDVSLVKLCEESLRVFHCDIMEYLTSREISEVLSPLTVVAEDPRCLGYPVPLWLAHEFSKPSDSMLFSYHDKVENVLAEAGLLEILRREEFSCSFADEIHGIRHAFEWEWWE
ncbi:MAG: DNA double-strand break repair nuclease NurA [Candidatus Bathyarchaeia archaeon]